MKLLDEKGKLFGILNVIDLFILLLIGSLVGFGGYKILKTNPSITATTRKALMEVEIKEIRQVSVDAFEVGDLVKDYDKNTVLGTVVDKQVFQSKRLVTTADGRVVEADVPIRFDMVLTLECDAVVSPSTTLIGGQELRIGGPLGIKNPKIATRGIVFNITYK